MLKPKCHPHIEQVHGYSNTTLHTNPSAPTRNYLRGKWTSVSLTPWQPFSLSESSIALHLELPCPLCFLGDILTKALKAIVGFVSHFWLDCWLTVRVSYNLSLYCSVDHHQKIIWPIINGYSNDIYLNLTILLTKVPVINFSYLTFFQSPEWTGFALTRLYAYPQLCPKWPAELCWSFHFWSVSVTKLHYTGFFCQQPQKTRKKFTTAQQCLCRLATVLSAERLIKVPGSQLWHCIWSGVSFDHPPWAQHKDQAPCAKENCWRSSAV